MKSNSSEIGHNAVRNLTAVAATIGTLLATAIVTGCSAEPAQPKKYREECSAVINKAIISHSEFDVGRYMWDGTSQFMVVTEHFIALQSGDVRKLNEKKYLNTFVGDEICDKRQVSVDYNGPSKVELPPYQNPITPSTPNAICSKVADAEVVYKDSYSLGTVIFDGTWTKELTVYPVLSAPEFGAIVVSNDDYLRNPVGAVACFDKTDIQPYK